MFENVILQSFNEGYNRAMKHSEDNRLKIHEDFSAFYYNDYEVICDILREYTLNNPYSAETLKTLHFRHIDQLDKMLSRLTAGIYNQRPIRKLVSGETEDEDFIKLLGSIQYAAKVKECFRAAKFFNIAFIQPVYDSISKAMRLDVITPNDVIVKTKDEDYLQIEKIKIRKAVGGNIREVVWSDSEHYYIEGGKEYNAKGGNGANPYGVIPISTLRIKPSRDFYGEPDWNLYLEQINSDIGLTEMKEAEQKIIHQVWLAINLNIGKNEIIKPGEIFTANKIQEGEVIPSLESVNSNYDFASLRENLDWYIKQLALSRGLSASSVSGEVNDLSGIAKIVDNQELEETKQETKEILYNFEIDLMKKIAIVSNVSGGTNFNLDAEFEMQFVEDPSTETVQDKNERRDMEKKYFISNEVDFVIEDKELNSREEAIEWIKQRKQESKLIGNAEETNPEDTEPGMDSNGDESEIETVE